MNTDRELLQKSFKFFSITVILMFLGPFVIHQAFKNEGHPFYIPVLILGLIISFGAIVLGFYSLRLILRAIFSKK
ncbi:hypothetical protein GWK08_07490 [Leptobacterium flavescens]|uniref:DUF3955 domain-containing protein n=1 Tax=Leptobacterium flavescens TaxID=472055 RepID=A0A6P0USD0_9FLAO|nr:DUF6095 family protein [Leptobacterium flavescens]NER13276.1 hypothetical protein [Leptobacterium flavescens]